MLLMLLSEKKCQCRHSKAENRLSSQEPRAGSLSSSLCPALGSGALHSQVESGASQNAGDVSGMGQPQYLTAGGYLSEEEQDAQK
jgi:hypothetical protein